MQQFVTPASMEQLHIVSFSQRARWLLCRKLPEKEVFCDCPRDGPRFKRHCVGFMFGATLTQEFCMIPVTWNWARISFLITAIYQVGRDLVIIYSKLSSSLILFRVTNTPRRAQFVLLSKQARFFLQPDCICLFRQLSLQ